MSLTGRFSLLFLAALALILSGFSAAHYLSTKRYFDHRVNGRLESALAVLSAAAEFDDDEVEWEQEDRRLPVGPESGDEQVSWVVLDGRGRMVDQSRNDQEGRFGASGRTRRDGSMELTDRAGRPWRVAQRRLTAPGPHTRGKPKEALVLTVSTPLWPSREALASIGWSLAVGGVGFWVAAALMCRWVSRRALAPLRRMAESARGLDASDSGWGLDTAKTGDELEELGQAFNDLLGRLHVAYERQRRFSGDASHQLRTPLTVLIGQIEVALRRDRPDEEYRRVLRSALGRAEQLSRIVEALLFLNRAEGEAALPEGEVLGLGRWVSGHLDMRGSVERASPVLVRRLEGDGPVVRGHAALMGQMLDNLLENAEKYGRAGGSAVVETGRQGAWAVLAVEDSGPGIPEGDRDRVFEPFYRADQARREGISGVGLGLAVVRRIARAFGGEAKVGNPRGPGCRIEVWWPVSGSG